MDIISKCSSWGKNFLIILTSVGIFIGLFFSFVPEIQNGEAISLIDESGFWALENLNNLPLIAENSLFSISQPANPDPVPIQKIRVVITAYSSTVDQTDLDPFVTAAGTIVRDGVIATNILPFGTKIQLPELYGDKVFVVEDRMHWKKRYHIDIWFPSRDEALQFGTTITDALIFSN